MSFKNGISQQFDTYAIIAKHGDLYKIEWERNKHAIDIQLSSNRLINVRSHKLLRLHLVNNDGHSEKLS